MKRNNKNSFDSILDSVGRNILQLLLQNYNNKEISANLKIPLSTTQRRVRNLIENEFISSRSELNYKKFGCKQGLLHIYLNDGNLDEILDKLSNLIGIVSIEVHIGNSDILAGIIYKEGPELLKVVTSIKQMEGVERIVWSEMILQYPIKRNIPKEIL